MGKIVDHFELSSEVRLATTISEIVNYHKSEVSCEESRKFKCFCKVKKVIELGATEVKEVWFRAFKTYKKHQL